MSNRSFSLWRYRLTTWLLFVPVMVFTAVTAARQHNLRYLSQRLGKGYPQHDASICIHCASVGEINTALPLLRLLTKHTSLPIVVTTNTITGAAVLEKKQLSGIIHAYLPLDYAFAVKRFYQAIRPQCIFVMETEIWPVFIREGSRKNIPLFIINGRISAKTKSAPQWLLKTYRHTLSQLQHVYARSNYDYRQFIELGLPTSQCTTLDDLKYASESEHTDTTPSPLNTLFILCVSTHDNEELQIAQEWLRQGSAACRLVIAPRHPDRIKKICKQFQQSNISYFLHHSQTGNAEGIYLIDTVGELTPFMQHAQLVFVGGSLVDRGGHNVLEAARYQKCVLIGTYHANFLQIVNELGATDGLIVVNDVHELILKCHELLNNHAERERVANNAYWLVQNKSDIHYRYLEVLRPYLEGLDR